ncbi:MAG TPA: hypothetical protein VFA81_01905 [Burkholderiales bacterium]|nr:hypothetical protein [Burkholderiales bacterium]
MARASCSQESVDYLAQSAHLLHGVQVMTVVTLLFAFATGLALAQRMLGRVATRSALASSATTRRSARQTRRA